MKSKAPIIERRFVDGALELRDEDEALTFRGYAAVFDRETDIGGMFRERVARGAFAKTIQEADVRLLYNHDPDSVMARTTNGTLRLEEDERGLRVTASLQPEDADVQRLVPKLRAGHVSQMSFGFRAVKDEWDESQTPPLRTLREVALYDVSAVTFPAYPGTEAQIRDAAAYLRRLAPITGVDVTAPRFAARILADLPASADVGMSPEELRDLIQALSAHLDAEPPAEPPKRHSRHSLELALRHNRLMLQQWRLSWKTS